MADRPETKRSTDPHAACTRELARVQAQRDALGRCLLEIADEYGELDDAARDAIRERVEQILAGVAS